MVKEYFEYQLSGGATDQFFYGIENHGEVRIQRHRGTLDTLPTGLEFTRMVGSTPFFQLDNYDEAGGQAGWSN